MPTQRHLTNLSDRSAALGATKHSLRAAALTAATTEINDTAARELTALRKEITALEDARTARLAAAAAAVEQMRRARAAALCTDLFAPDALPRAVHTFREDPTRSAALAIRAIWDRFSERCKVEVGDALAAHVIEAAFIDDIAAQPGLAGAVNFMSGMGDHISSVIEALGRATHPLATPQSVLDALVTLESQLLTVAHQHRDVKPDADHTAMHGLRRSNATHRDLLQARGELAAQQGARRAEEFARTYNPPPSLGGIIRARLALLNGQQQQ